MHLCEHLETLTWQVGEKQHTKTEYTTQKKTYHINIYEINHEQSQKTFTFEMALSASSGEETKPEIQPAPGQLMR